MQNSELKNQNESIRAAGGGPPVLALWPAAFDVWIGTRWLRSVDPRISGSNPYANLHAAKLTTPAELAGAVRAYEAIWRHRLAGPARRIWRPRLAALAGQRLGCTCNGPGCHGPVLIALWREFCEDQPCR
jgi:hypothetical protein